MSRTSIDVPFLVLCICLCRIRTATCLRQLWVLFKSHYLWAWCAVNDTPAGVCECTTPPDLTSPAFLCDSYSKSVQLSILKNTLMAVLQMDWICAHGPYRNARIQTATKRRVRRRNTPTQHQDDLHRIKMTRREGQQAQERQMPLDVSTSPGWQQGGDSDRKHLIRGEGLLARTCACPCCPRLTNCRICQLATACGARHTGSWQYRIRIHVLFLVIRTSIHW